MQNERSRFSELDALIAAPENHKLLFENDSVRVLDTSIAAGQSTSLHTHCWPAALYFLSWSDFVRRDEHGNTILDSRHIPSIAPGSALWTSSLGPHTLENIGQCDLRVIAIELKSTLQLDESVLRHAEDAAHRERISLEDYVLYAIREKIARSEMSRPNA